MKKLAIVLAVTIALGGCSTFGKKTAAEQKPVVAEFVGGNLKVNYTMSGELDSIVSSNSVRLTSTLPYAQDEAYSLATLRAKKQIVQFMREELETEKFASTIYKSLQDAEAEDGKETSKTIKSEIVGELQSNIKQKSSAILQGVFVDEKSYDAKTNTITVVVKTSAKTVDTAKALRKLMGN